MKAYRGALAADGAARGRARSPGQARRPRPRRGATGPLGDSRTDLLVVGSGRRCESVASSLALLDVVVRTTLPSGVTTASLDKVIGLVFVEPLQSTWLTSTVAGIRNHRPNDPVPLFVVLARQPSPARVARLYRTGVTAVFEWPRESGVLPHVVAELIGVAEVRGRPTSRDAGLARAVRARLKLQGIRGGQVRVKARGGHVELSGNIDSLWRKNLAVSAAQRAPGVRQVTATKLHVEAGGISDRALARSVRELVRAVSPEMARTVGASVDRGIVTLAGSAVDRRAITRLVRLAENIEAVREVKNFLTISSLQHRQDRTQARALQRALDDMFPGHRATVSVFGGVGVVSGKVKSLETKAQISELFEDWASLRRVINKLQVA